MSAKANGWEKMHVVNSNSDMGKLQVWSIKGGE